MPDVLLDRFYVVSRHNGADHISVSQIMEAVGIDACCCQYLVENLPYDKYGYHILDATLRLTLATWESETNSLSANFLKAIARIIAVFGDALREDIFKEHVGRCSVKSIIRTAKERRPGVLGYAEAMLIAYNAKNKYRLPIKKLYGSQRDEELDDEETDDDTAAI